MRALSKTINILALLIVGFAVGYTIANCRYGTCLLSPRGPGSFHPHDRKNPDDHLVDFFTKKLDLTEDQRTDLKSILKAQKEKLRAIHDKTMPAFKEIRANTSAAISEILTDEQKRAFELLEREREQRHKRHRHGGPPMGPPPPPPPF